MGIVPHPDRVRVLAELHARPFTPVPTPHRVLHFAFQVSPIEAEQDRARVEQLSDGGARPSGWLEDKRHLSMDGGRTGIAIEQNVDAINRREALRRIVRQHSDNLDSDMLARLPRWHDEQCAAGFPGKRGMQPLGRRRRLGECRQLDGVRASEHCLSVEDDHFCRFRPEVQRGRFRIGRASIYDSEPRSTAGRARMK